MKEKVHATKLHERFEVNMGIEVSSYFMLFPRTAC